jgi:ATP synthase protein I
MTTESKQQSPRRVTPLLGATMAGFGAGLLLVVVAAFADGAAGARGAAAGVGITVVTFGWGTGVVSAVSRVMPSASLLIALLTFALQLMVMGVATKVVVDASDGGAYFSHAWLAAGVVLGALAFIVAQVWCTVRQRTLAYELPAETPGSRTEAGE